MITEVQPTRFAPASTRIEEAMRLITSWGLDGMHERPPFRPEGEQEWTRLLARIRFERISGFAVEAAGGGGLVLSEQQSSDLLGQHKAGMLWCLHAEKKLLRLVDTFDHEGIDFAVLKGPALAHTVYEEPCLRPFGDLDLLVRSRDYDNACALLARVGHTRLRPEPRPGWEARFGKASVHVHPDDGVEVDLHRTLVLGPIGQWIDGDELMDFRSTFPLGGRDIPCLDDTGTLVNVALHASLGWAQARATPTRDTVQVDQKGSLDHDRLTSWAEEWHLAAALSLTNNIVQTQCGCSCRALASLRLEKTRRDERILKSYTERRSLGRLPLTTLWAIRGFAAKAKYSFALAFPDRRFLRHRKPAAGRSGPLPRLDRLLGWVRTSRPAGVRTHRSRTR